MRITVSVYTPFAAFGRLGSVRSFLPTLSPCSSLSPFHINPSPLAGAFCRSLLHKISRLGAPLSSLISLSGSGIFRTSRCKT